MGLRETCIEAMAKRGYQGDAWDEVDDMTPVIWMSDAEQALDAFLDALVEIHPACLPQDCCAIEVIGVLRVERED